MTGYISALEGLYICDTGAERSTEVIKASFVTETDVTLDPSLVREGNK